MDFKQSLDKGVFFGFVPHRLEMKQFPEFYNFPYNVLFMRYGTRDGKQVSGSAIYEPEFWTYKKEDNLSSMRYHNIYGGDSYLMITCDEKDQKYRGEKFVSGKSVGSACGGVNWKMFFVHLTALGLSEGEQCKFEDIA